MESGPIDLSPNTNSKYDNAADPKTGDAARSAVVFKPSPQRGGYGTGSYRRRRGP